MPDPDDKLTRLTDILKDLDRFALAVSGGLDSRFLCLASQQSGLSPLLAFVRGPHLSPLETSQAMAWLAGRGLEFEVIDLDPLDLPEVAANTDKRCYYCKRHMFSAIKTLARGRGLNTVIDGGNLSDQKEYRPGIRALAELGVISPLARAGLSKADIRQLARRIGLDRPDQPARACLLTRFAYGFRPDANTLARLGRAEDALAALGFREYRLRLPAPGQVVLQLDERESGLWDRQREPATNSLTRAGFTDVDVRFAQGISGFFDLKKSPEA